MAFQVTDTHVSSSAQNATAHATLYRSRQWHTAYMEALFEADRNKIGERIRRAEQLIVAREHELFAIEGDPVERRSLNSALHALHALRACLGF